jgi:phage shock protein C
MNRFRNSRQDDDVFLGRHINPHRLYRSQSRWLAGVAGGLAEYLGLNVLGTRIAIFVMCVLFPPLIVFYIVMIFVLRRRPENLFETRSDEAFWRTTAIAPQSSFSELRYRFRTMEERVRDVEAYVTSAKYEFERELRGK